MGVVLHLLWRHLVYLDVEKGDHRLILGAIYRAVRGDGSGGAVSSQDGAQRHRRGYAVGVGIILKQQKNPVGVGEDISQLRHRTHCGGFFQLGAKRAGKHGYIDAACVYRAVGIALLGLVKRQHSNRRFRAFCKERVKAVVGYSARLQTDQHPVAGRHLGAAVEGHVAQVPDNSGKPFSARTPCQQLVAGNKERRRVYFQVEQRDQDVAGGDGNEAHAASFWNRQAELIDLRTRVVENLYNSYNVQGLRWGRV